MFPGILSSLLYLGATRMMPQVPATQAKLNSHRRILSRTIATYFQSSDTWEGRRCEMSCCEGSVCALGNLNSLNSLDVKIECVWIEN